MEQDRKDLAQDEMNQLAFLQLYLPVQMEEDEVREIVKEVLDFGVTEEQKIQIIFKSHEI